MAEIWKDIPGYEGRYQASTEGRIRSVDHDVTCVPRDGKRAYTKRMKGQVLRPCIGANGYPYVGLRKEQRSDNAQFLPVFHLIARTFLGERPRGTFICHQDGDKLNSRILNLRYDTPTENQIDVYRQGGRYGKLSIEAVRDIKRRLARGESKSSIARVHGVSKTAIYYIATGEHFGWLSI